MYIIVKNICITLKYNRYYSYIVIYMVYTIVMKLVLNPIEQGEETCYSSQEDSERTL